MSFIFELVTSPLGLPVHWLIEYIMMGIIGWFAFSIGWEISDGGPFGSFIHWVVRTAAFVAIWAVVYKLCEFGQWIYHLIW